MKKKTILAVIFAFAVVLLSSSCFAVNEVVGGVAGDAVNGAMDAGSAVANGTSNVIGGIANGVGNVAGEVTNGVGNVAGDVANGMNSGINATSNMVQNMSNDSLMSNTSTEYNATTAGTIDANTFLGMNMATWWWVIIVMIIILVVILVWHYSTNSDGDHSDK